jgi:ssDNA-binding Zn-finger/Zn-ribbon topoisomerase 1
MVVTKKKAQRMNTYSIQHPQFVGCTEYPQCGYTTTVTEQVREIMTAPKPELVLDF